MFKNKVGRKGLVGRLCLVAALGAPGAAGAGAVLGLEAGRSTKGVALVERLNLGLWADSFRLEGAGWMVRPRLQLGVGTMQAIEPEPGDNRRLFELTARPIVRLQPGREARWFLEAGSGPVYLSNRRIGDLDLGGHLQFRSHAGAGARFGADGRLQLVYRYSHTSNAGIDQPNPGINFQSIELGTAF
jgi:hypothetical protein